MNESRPRIRVVNPNSNEAVTRGIDAALEPLRFANGPEIVCSTLAEGPFGIESQADAESVVMPLLGLIAADNSSDAFVIACFSDPGLHVCREGTPRPVFASPNAACWRRWRAPTASASSPSASARSPGIRAICARWD
jgi:Asp/Glu/hydantoin racemase